jgi:hypothetical protein
MESWETKRTKAGRESIVLIGRYLVAHDTQDFTARSRKESLRNSVKLDRLGRELKVK